MEYFRKQLPIIADNQAAIPPEKRLNPRNGPLTAFGKIVFLTKLKVVADKEKKDQPAESKGLKMDDIIVGLYSKKDLQAYFAGEEAA